MPERVRPPFAAKPNNGASGDQGPPVTTLVDFLVSPLALARLAEAAERPDSLVFRRLGKADRERAMELVRELRTACDEVTGGRHVLATKRMRESARRELRGSVADAQARMRAVAGAIPISNDWVMSLLKEVEQAAQDAAQHLSVFGAMERETAIPARKLPKILREARTNPTQLRLLARRFHVKPEDVQRMAERARVASTALSELGRVHRIPFEELIRLGEAAGALVADLRQRVPAPRGVGRSEGARSDAIAVDVRALESRIEEVAATVHVSSDLPLYRHATGGRPRISRRVAFLPQSAEAPGPRDGPNATRADLGRLGEALVFALMRGRWERAAKEAPERTAALLQRIARECWATDADVLTDVAALLRKPPDAWFESPVVRDLLWPARTVYGDAMGFDIFGLADCLDDWLCVEVKTTLGPPATQFELTANELRCAKREGSRYAIARVANVNAECPTVHLWTDPASLVESGVLSLTPSSYSASFSGKRSDGSASSPERVNAR